MPNQFSIWGLAALVIAALLATWFRRIENRKSQQIKDLRAKIDSVFEDLNSIEDLSGSYYLKPAAHEDAQATALQIKNKIKRVGTQVTLLHNDPTLTQFSKNVSLLTRHIRFKQAVTLDDFDAADRKVLSAHDPKFERISKSSDELKQALERIYNENQ